MPGPKPGALPLGDALLLQIVETYLYGVTSADYTKNSGVTLVAR